MSGEHGYYYDVIQTNGEGWGVLDVMREYQQHLGYESFGTMIDQKTGVLCLLVKSLGPKQSVIIKICFGPSHPTDGQRRRDQNE